MSAKIVFRPRNANYETNFNTAVVCMLPNLNYITLIKQSKFLPNNYRADHWSVR